MHQSFRVPVAQSDCTNSMIIRINGQTIMYNPEDQSDAKQLSAYGPSAYMQQ